MEVKDKYDLMLVNLKVRNHVTAKALYEKLEAKGLPFTLILGILYQEGYRDGKRVEQAKRKEWRKAAREKTVSGTELPPVELPQEAIEALSLDGEIMEVASNE